MSYIFGVLIIVWLYLWSIAKLASHDYGMVASLIVGFANRTISLFVVYWAFKFVGIM